MALPRDPADAPRGRHRLPRRNHDAADPAAKASKKLGGGEIIVKDEGRLPTGSFKARGLVMAVSMGKGLGIEHIAMPTKGNAGAALAA